MIARMPDGALYFEQTHWPFLERDDLAHIPEAFGECMWTAIAAACYALSATIRDYQANSAICVKTDSKR